MRIVTLPGVFRPISDTWMLAERLVREPAVRGGSVLDLGCGGGFFLFVLQHLGHDCLGLDIAEFPLFTQLLDLFQVERRVWKGTTTLTLVTYRRP